MGKRTEQANKLLDKMKEYVLEDAVGILKQAPKAKFDESVDMAANLGIDARKTDQMVRGTVLLPHGTGAKVRVVVFAKGEKEKEARDAGADFVGADDLVEKIKAGWLDFDKAVATPDMMGSVGKIGKILGPRGLMPNPKLGTVTFDVGKAVQELKAGKVEYKTDKAGIVHMPIGKISFSEAAIADNARAAVAAIVKAKPSTSKGKYIKKISISTTMGPGVRVDAAKLAEK